MSVGRQKQPDRNQLYAIYVLPEYHGRGIGTAMWQAAQQYLNSNKHTLVEVAIYNTTAIKFYANSDSWIRAGACLIPSLR